MTMETTNRLTSIAKDAADRIHNPSSAVAGEVNWHKHKAIESIGDNQFDDDLFQMVRCTSPQCKEQHFELIKLLGINIMEETIAFEDFVKFNFESFRFVFSIEGQLSMIYNTPARDYGMLDEDLDNLVTFVKLHPALTGRSESVHSYLSDRIYHWIFGRIQKGADYNNPHDAFLNESLLVKTSNQVVKGNARSRAEVNETFLKAVLQEFVRFILSILVKYVAKREIRLSGIKETVASADEYEELLRRIVVSYEEFGVPCPSYLTVSRSTNDGWRALEELGQIVSQLEYDIASSPDPTENVIEELTVIGTRLLKQSTHSNTKSENFQENHAYLKGLQQFQPTTFDDTGCIIVHCFQDAHTRTRVSDIGVSIDLNYALRPERDNIKYDAALVVATQCQGGRPLWELIEDGELATLTLCTDDEQMKPLFEIKLRNAKFNRVEPKEWEAAGGRLISSELSNQTIQLESNGKSKCVSYLE